MNACKHWLQGWTPRLGEFLAPWNTIAALQYIMTTLNKDYDHNDDHDYECWAYLTDWTWCNPNQGFLCFSDFNQLIYAVFHALHNKTHSLPCPLDFWPCPALPCPAPWKTPSLSIPVWLYLNPSFVYKLSLYSKGGNGLLPKFPNFLLPFFNNWAQSTYWHDCDFWANFIHP